MKKIVCIFIVIFLLVGLIVVGFVGCGTFDMETHSSANQHETNQNGEPYQLSFIAEFYDNAGQNWLTTQGSRFNISPNKVKEYYWDSDGSWISGWTMSSIVSVDIDGNNIETCASSLKSMLILHLAAMQPLMHRMIFALLMPGPSTGGG